MDRLAFTAVSAVNEQRIARQQLVHEISNVNTVGFKRSYDSSLKAMEAQGAGFPTRTQPLAFAVDLIQLVPGPMMVTGRPLDVAMNHESVLGVTAANNELAFTRRGDLRINPNGVLEVGSGQAVRGDGGGPITVPQGFVISIGDDGSVFAADPAQAGSRPQVVGRLLLRDASETRLVRREDGLFAVEGKPGADITNGRKLPSLVSNALEGSNVNAIGAMVKMLDQARSFEAQIRVVKEARSNDESGATMLRTGA